VAIMATSRGPLGGAQVVEAERFTDFKKFHGENLAAKEHKELKKRTEERPAFLPNIFVFSAFFCG